MCELAAGTTLIIDAVFLRQALQIGPEAGKPGPLHYVETPRHVQRSGKNLHIALEPHEIIDSDFDVYRLPGKVAIENVFHG